MKKYYLSILFLFLLLLPISSFADSLKIMTGAKVLESRGELLSYSELFYQSKVNKVYLLEGRIKYTYGEHDDTKNYETVVIEQCFNYNILSSVYFTLNSNFRHDIDTQIEHEVMIMPGIGFYAIQKKNISVSIDTGPAYRITKSKHQSLSDQVDFCTRLKGTYKDPLFSTKGKLEYYIDPKQAKNYKIMAEAEMEIYPFQSITNLGFKFKAINNYRNITKNKHNEITGIAGIVYCF